MKYDLMKNKLRLHPFLIFIFIAIVLTSCAPGSEKFSESAAGFWMGMWHGFISFFTFLIGLFSDTVSIYENNNNGNWYDFGFILGITFFYGGGSKSSCKW